MLAVEHSSAPILVVDDNEIDVEIIERVLTGCGVISHAFDGESAVRLAAEREFALALIDIHLLGMDGFEVADLIRQSPSCARTPIIFMTNGPAVPQSLERAYNHGAADYILKNDITRFLRPKVAVFVELFHAREQSRSQSERLLEMERREHEARMARSQREARDLNEQLEVVNLRFDSLMEFASDFIVLLDTTGRIVAATRRAEECLLGPAAANCRGRRFHELLAPTLVAEVAPGFDALIEKGTLAIPSAAIVTFDGRKAILEISATMVGKPPERMALVMARDITERSMLEKQLRQAQKMEAVGRLAGGIAHDFNNLLTIISGHSEFVLERVRDRPEAAADAEVIRSTAARAANLTKQLLIFSRRQNLRPEVLDLQSVVRDTDQMLRRLLGEDVRIDTFGSLDLGPVLADRGEMEQVVMNLAINARDAMPDGGTLTIQTSNATVDEGYTSRQLGVPAGSYVLLAVTDTGCGMDRETQSHIFEPFFTTKEKGKGTGLGLSTVYGIVNRCQGAISVYSEPGQGSTFRIFLPAYTGDAPAQAKPATPTPLARGSGTVLVVDDEPGIRSLVRRVLTSLGYSVLEATDGAEAIRIAEAHPAPIELLLTDLVMPGQNGLTLAEQCVATHPSTKVLFMSGFPVGSHQTSSVLAEGAAFLAKPFSPASLLSSIQTLMGTPVRVGSGG